MTEILGYLSATSTALFGVAGDTIEFVTANPICLVGLVMWLFVSAAGIVRSLVKGV